MDYEDLKKRLEELQIDLTLYDIKFLGEKKYQSVTKTDKYIRKRRFDPGKCDPKKIRTKDLGNGKKAVVCKRKDTGKWDAQAILIPRSDKNAN